MASPRLGVVRARVPATSANLGPGFDCFGLALARYDLVTACLIPEGLIVEVEGEGADDVPRDESHLVAAAVLRAFREWTGRPPSGLLLRCHNSLPHGRGLGSSAAAIVAGLLAARALLADGSHVTPDDVLDLAVRLEGHPDNVAACLFGGLTLSWTYGGTARAVRLKTDPRIRPVVCIPGWSLSTEQARGLLPDQVSHADAVFNASRSALLVAALTVRPDLMLDATADRLHQPYRAPAMRPTADLVARLREAGVAAVVSGAGPTVLALTVADQASAAADLVGRVAGADWQVESVAVDAAGAQVEYVEPDARYSP
jgi:homoserine kinase